MDDQLRQLCSKQENAALLLTNAACYMSLAGNTLKELYPFLMHVTCIARLLNNCTTRVPAYFENIYGVVATIKAATIKIKDRKKDIHVASLPSLSDPEITKWTT